MDTFLFLILLSINSLFCKGYEGSKYYEQPHMHSKPKMNHISSMDKDSLATECGMREVALNFSQQLINRYNDRIYDALQLNECVNQSNFIKSNYKNERNYHQINAKFNEKFQKYLSNIVYNEDGIKIIEFYVDINNGNDKNDGSKEKPFAHIKTAKNNIQAMMKSTAYSNVQFIVYIREGTYFEGTFNFGVDDNGLSAQYPIIYAAHNQENVIISGEIDIQPKGYAYSIGPYNGQQSHSNDAIYIDISVPSRNSTIYPYFGSDNDPRGRWEAYHIGGDAQRFVDDKNFWNGTVPAGLTYNVSDNLLHLNDSFESDEFIANVYHEALWGNWLFSIDHINASSGQIGFDFGGFQEAHGGSMSSGTYNKEHPQPFYVENDIQCLNDAQSEGEWYLDTTANALYLKPNKSDSTFMKNVKNVKYDSNGDFISFDLDIQFPANYHILDIIGESVELPVANLLFYGITFTHSLRTQMLGYEVPSGGDWSIHRGGAVFLQNAVNISFFSCTFLRNGGNDLFLSKYNEHINISSNNFLYSGDSSIAIVGKVGLMDGFNQNEYAKNVWIDANYMELIGVFGKQTSALFTSVAGSVTFSNNVLHSGPRAGINVNDGFYGSKVIENNLIFNWVRETQDHGPINTWDRVEYVFADSNGRPTVIPQWNRIAHNFIYNGPNGNKSPGNLFPAVDNDDGSRMYYIEDNVMIYGGTKNYLGDDKIWNNNLIVFPSHWPGGGQCITAWSGLNHVFMGNQCIAKMHNPLYYGACNPIDFEESSKEMPFGQNNALFVPNAKFVFNCGADPWTLQDLQQRGWELNTTINDVPKSQQIVDMVREKVNNWIKR